MKTPITILMMLIFSLAFTQNFTEYLIEDFTGLSRPNQIFGADIDSDGDVDIISSYYQYNSSFVHTSDILRLYSNDGSQNFTETTIASGSHIKRISKIEVVDIDLDNDMDVLIISTGGNSIYWYENTGTSFTEHLIEDLSSGNNNTSSPTDFKIIDADGDTDLDILLASSESDKLILYKNNGSEAFTPNVLGSNYNKITCVDAIDINEDGFLDVVFGVSNSGGFHKISWLEYDGSSSYTEHLIVDDVNTVYGISDMIVGDFDGDSDLDIVTATYNNTGFFRNDGTNTFIYEAIETYSSITTSKITVFDVDPDLDLDVVIHSTNQLKLFKNSGAAIFTSENIMYNYQSTSINHADVNSDGYIDILFCGTESNTTGDIQLKWYGNDFNALGINDNNLKTDFKFYPNPTTSKLNIDLGIIYPDIEVTLLNTLGQKILRKNYSSTQYLDLTINSIPGLYFVELKKSGEKLATLKILKE
jgi:hypothetical protein